jgi:hypothetical protein
MQRWSRKPIPPPVAIPSYSKASLVQMPCDWTATPEGAQRLQKNCPPTDTLRPNRNRILPVRPTRGLS